MARVDLIIPTFNGTPLLLVCLNSMLDSTFTDFKLIVVDDGSGEPVDSAVRALMPAAVVLRNDRNEGLTRSFNRAIDSSDSEYVVLLNDDTEVEPDWLENLVSCADRHPDAGSIASKLRLQSDRAVIHSAGDTYSVRAMPGNRGVWLDDFGQYDVEEPIFAACAGAALYRRSALDRVRLDNGEVFDTRLFMYCEDVDLAWRLQINGFSCVFSPHSIVYHHLSATGGGDLASYYVSRNIWLVLARSVPRQFWSQYRGRIIAYNAGRLVRTLRATRESATRRSVAGTVAGVCAFMLHRDNVRCLGPGEFERIRALLVQH